MVDIKGKVINSTTEQPVSGATITLESTGFSTISNHNGLFVIHFNPKETNVIIVSHIGYLDTRTEVSKSSLKNGLIIKIEESSLNLSEVEILDKITTKAPYTIESISTLELKETNISDLGKLISNEPNVGGIRKGATGIDPVIRGFKYSQVTVQIDDGTRIEGGCPNRMDPTAAHININDISNIKIYKGPFALKYGPGFGGLVILETNKPVYHERFKNNISMIIGGQTNHLGYRSGIRVDGGNKFIAYNLSANKNSYGNYESGNGDIFKASSDNYNVSAALGFRLAEGHVITIGADRSWGRNVDYPTLPMDERSDDTEVTNLSYLGTIQSKMVNFIKFSAYHSDVNHEMDNKNRPFSDTVVAISKIHARNAGGRFAINLNALSGNLEVGINFEQINKDGNRYKNLIMQPGLPVLTENLWNNAKINNTGLYAEYNKNTEKINWVAALRADYNNATSGPMTRLKKNGTVVYNNDETDSEYFNFSFSAGLTWHITTKSDLEVSFGKGTRSPDMTERFIILLPVGYDPYDYLGNPELKPENNHEIDLGFVRTCERSGQFTASVFFSYVTDYISAVIVPPSQLAPQTKGVLGVKQFTNIDDAYLTGFEIKHSTPDKNKWQFRFNAAYTMGMNPSATKIIYENGNAVDEEIIKNDPLPEIPPFEANFWFSYKFLSNKLIPELNFKVAAKQNKVSEAYYEETTPGFNLFNFKIKYTYNTNLTLVFGVKNIFNTNYYQHLNRRIIGSKTPFFDPGRIFYTNLIIKL